MTIMKIALGLLLISTFAAPAQADSHPSRVMENYQAQFSRIFPLCQKETRAAHGYASAPAEARVDQDRRHMTDILRCVSDRMTVVRNASR